ncbi:MAG: glycine C-acetyltransferase, partial [Candidatus Aminicenantaceae bacterium]
MYGKIKEDLTKEIQSIHDAGLYKSERIIMTPQGAEIEVKGGKKVLNFCANNYLGLSSHPKVIEAAHKALDEWGYGMSSVRFICGTQDIHKILEKKISDFLQTDDTILFAACFDANGGVFEPLIAAEDAIITDQLNHASIIDGIRLCKAQRYIYKHGDMADLEEKLKETQELRYRLVATDGVFSMDGDIAKLDEICELADKYDALVLIDDAHSTGFIGKTGRGTPEYRGVMGRIDIITGTLGKALGGASGGFISGKKELIELYRQRSRPYLFSNTVSP